MNINVFPLNCLNKRVNMDLHWICSKMESNYFQPIKHFWNKEALRWITAQSGFCTRKCQRACRRFYSACYTTCTWASRSEPPLLPALVSPSADWLTARFYPQSLCSWVREAIKVMKETTSCLITAPHYPTSIHAVSVSLQTCWTFTLLQVQFMLWWHCADAPAGSVSMNTAGKY